MTECQCFSCTKARSDKLPDLVPGVSWFATEKFTMMQRMFLCGRCGNKRCPHATDHRLACTDSNEPGQAGSRYQ